MINKQEASRERFHFLDGLRGIASLLVVLHHSVSGAIGGGLINAGYPYLGNLLIYFTQSGVVLFFVLSGVVLLRPYVRGERKFKTVNYFIRRARRIFPPFLAALVFGYLVILLIKYGPTTFYSPIWNWVDISFPELLRQALIINHSGIYFNLAWWSLQIEAIFYILVPAFVFLFSISKQLNYIRVFAVLAGTLIGSYLLQGFADQYFQHLYSKQYATLNMYRFIDYPLSFVLGVYLARFDFDLWFGRVLCIAGIGFILFSGTYGPLINSGYSMLYAGIMIFAFKEQWLQRILDKPIMIWIGERSYSLFLIHFSVFYLVDYICSMIFADRNIYYGIATRSFGVLLAFIMALLLFHFVERRQAKGLITDKAFWPWQIKKLPFVKDKSIIR